jgi:hypothetical protein
MSLDEAERRLSAIITGSAPEATGPVPLPVADRGRPALVPGRRKPPLLALGVGTVMVALVTGGAAWWSHRPAETSAPPHVPAVVRSSDAPSAVPETSHPPPSRTGTRRDTTPPSTSYDSPRTSYDPPRTMNDSPRRDEPRTTKPSTKQTRPEPTKSPRTEPDEPTPTKPERATPRESPENESATKTPGQVDPADGNGQGQEARDNAGQKPKKAKKAKKAKHQA